MMWYDKHDEECAVWKTPINEEFACTCKGRRRQNSLPPDYVKPKHNTWVEQAWFGLENGFSSEEILADIGGIKWGTLLVRCERNLYDRLKRRLIALRAQENERTRAALR